MASDKDRIDLSELVQPEAADVGVVEAEEAERKLPYKRVEFNWVDAWAHVFESPEWVIDRFIGGSGVTLMSGSPGSMKSLIALDIALHLVDIEGALQEEGADAHTWHGLGLERWQDKGEEYRVGLLAAEAHKSEIYSRIIGAVMRAGHGADVGNRLASRIYITNSHDAETQLGDGLLPIVMGEAAKALGGQLNLLIVDSMPALSGADDENSATELQVVTQELRDTSEQSGVPIVAICHPSQRSAAGIESGLAQGKPPMIEAAVRGSTRIAANVDTIVSIAVNPNDGDWSNTMLVKTRHTQGDKDVWQVQREPVRLDGFINDRPVSKSVPAITQARQMPFEDVEEARVVTKQQLVAEALREWGEDRWISIAAYEAQVLPKSDELPKAHTIKRWRRIGDAAARAQGIEFQSVPHGKSQRIEFRAVSEDNPDAGAEQVGFSEDGS